MGLRARPLGALDFVQRVPSSDFADSISGTLIWISATTPLGSLTFTSTSP